MNTIIRENIWVALQALIDADAGASFKTVSRKLKHWDSVSPPDQPACFVCQGKEAAGATRPRLPTVWHLHGKIYVYAHTEGTQYDVPATIINPLIDRICDLLQPEYEEQTLGGLVVACRVNGEIETDEGLLGEQAVAIIPIEMLIGGTA